MASWSILRPRYVRLAISLLLIVFLSRIEQLLAAGGGGVGLGQALNTFPVLYREEENLTLARGQDLQRRRVLLGSAQTLLYGSVLTKGYYYVEVRLGTPAQQFELIVDTGSTVTYVPCSSCTQCGQHQDPGFLFAQSSTYQPVKCHDPQCESQACDELSQCTYARHYAEESTSSGVMVSDVLTLIGQSTLASPPRVVFGCETRETGDLYSQQADGIMGLGKGPTSVMTQLAKTGVVDDVFSLCYGGMMDGGGAMIVGANEAPPDMVFTPFDASRPYSPYYVLSVVDLKVNGQALQVGSKAFGQGYGNVLDSGTTFTYLPRAVFRELKKVFLAATMLARVAGPDPTYEDICFGGASPDPSQLRTSFPSLEFTLGGGGRLLLEPENFLFRHRLIDGAYCLGLFENSDKGTLIGGITTRNLLVRYDRAGKQLGFARRKCSSLLATPPPTDPPKPLSPPPLASAPPPTVVVIVPAPAVAPAAQEGWPAVAPVPGPVATECMGCVQRVVVDMKLATEFSTFATKIPSFIASMARDLQVAAEQVQILSYRKGSVILECAITPPPQEAGSLLSPSTAAQIVERLKGHRVQLQEETFGTYEVRSVRSITVQDDLDTVTDTESESEGKTEVGVVIGLGMLGVALAVAVAAAAGYGYKWWKRRQEGVPYMTVEVTNSRRASAGVDDTMVDL